jgi:hypothetical protein
VFGGQVGDQPTNDVLVQSMALLACLLVLAWVLAWLVGWLAGCLLCSRNQPETLSCCVIYILEFRIQCESSYTYFSCITM